MTLSLENFGLEEISSVETCEIEGGLVVVASAMTKAAGYLIGLFYWAAVYGDPGYSGLSGD